MDIWLILAGIVLLIGVPFWLAARKKDAGPEPQFEDYKREYNPRTSFDNAHKRWREQSSIAKGGKTVSRIVLVLGVTLFLMSFWVQVPTNKVGIFTSFGKPVDAQPNGFQLKMPWEKVVKFDASRQYLKFCGKGNDKDPAEDGKEFPSIDVKMEREAKGDVCAVISWQMRAGSEAERKQTIELYKAHKTFDRLTENFMAANSRSAVTSVYDLVNPMVPEKNLTYAQASDKLLTKLKELVGDEVSVISAQVTGVSYDPETQKRIDEMQAEYAKTEKAKQQEQTNAAISRANKALVESGKLTPEVLQAECIKISKEVGSPPGMCLQPGWGGFGSAQAAAK